MREDINQTSPYSLTILLKPGFHMGYPPQTFQVQYKRAPDKEFITYTGNVREARENDNDFFNIVIGPLMPDTTYDIRVRSRNMCPSGDPYSRWKEIKHLTTGMGKCLFLTVTDMLTDASCSRLKVHCVYFY